MSEPYVTRIIDLSITQSSAGTLELVAAVSGRRIRVHEITGSLDAAGSWQLKSATTAITGAIPALASVQVGIPWRTNPDGAYRTASGEALNLVTVTGKFLGVLKYAIE